MSNLMTKDMLCLYCEHPNEAEVWSSINVKEDPELKDVLLGGELNMIECEACRKIFYAEHFLLYHDPERELLAFVYPHDMEGERATYEEKTRTDFALTQASTDPADQLVYAPLTLFGLDQLVNVVEWDEEVAIQGEIVAVMSQQNGFPIRTLRPAHARAQNLPTVLPWREGSGAPRDQLLAGIETLERLNDRLFVYAKTRERLMQETSFQPQVEVRA